jgi:CRISPR-associated protein Cmr1
LQVKQVMGWPTGEPSPVVQAQTPSGLQSDLAAGLRQIRENIAEWARTTPPSTLNNPEFDVLHPDSCKVWVLDKPYDRWHEALEAIGLAMQGFRNRYDPPDYSGVKAAVTGRNLTQPVQRAAFGLPIVFYFRSLSGARGTLEGDDHDRRASPLLLRVTQLANGKFVLVLTIFYAKLLPDGERLKLRRQGPPAHVKTPDWTALDSFLTYLDSAVAPRLEVNYR